MAVENIFKKAKAYVKLHPRTSFQDAIQKVKGTKKSTVSGTKPKKKTVTTKTVKKATIGAIKRHTSPKKINSAYTHGTKILGQIDKLEADLKRAKGNDKKTFIKIAINAKHDELDAVKRKLKSA